MKRALAHQGKLVMVEYPTVGLAVHAGKAIQLPFLGFRFRPDAKLVDVHMKPMLLRIF